MVRYSGDLKLTLTQLKAVPGIIDGYFCGNSYWERSKDPEKTLPELDKVMTMPVLSWSVGVGAAVIEGMSREEASKENLRLSNERDDMLLRYLGCFSVRPAIDAVSPSLERLRVLRKEVRDVYKDGLRIDDAYLDRNFEKLFDGEKFAKEILDGTRTAYDEELFEVRMQLEGDGKKREEMLEEIRIKKDLRSSSEIALKNPETRQEISKNLEHVAESEYAKDISLNKKEFDGVLAMQLGNINEAMKRPYLSAAWIEICKLLQDENAKLSTHFGGSFEFGPVQVITTLGRQLITAEEYNERRYRLAVRRGVDYAMSEEGMKETTRKTYRSKREYVDSALQVSLISQLVASYFETLAIKDLAKDFPYAGLKMGFDKIMLEHDLLKKTKKRIEDVANNIWPEEDPETK